MERLDSAELYLLKVAVESKMTNLMAIIEKDSHSEVIMDLYGDYAVLLTKLGIMNREYKKELYSR